MFGVLLLAAAIGLLLWLASSVLLLAFAAILFSVFLDGAAFGVSRWLHLRRAWALALAIVTLGSLVGGFAWGVAPRISDQADVLITRLPQAVRSVAAELRQYDWGRWVLGQVELAGREAVLQRVSGWVSTLLWVVSSLVLTIIVGIYLAAEAARYKRGTLILVPGRHRDTAAKLMAGAAHTMRWWLVGQMVAMGFTGVTTFVGLRALEVPLALTLSVLTAVLTFVPNIGAIVSAVPPALLALQDGFFSMLSVVALYVVLQTTEGYFVTPMAQRRAVHLPPALLLLTQVLMGVLFGLLGVILAAPLTAVAVTWTHMLYIDPVFSASASGH